MPVAAIAAPIDTRTARRRLVHFTCVSDVAADLARLESAHRAGTLRQTGNRSPAAILDHLGASIRGSFDGLPGMERAAPLPLRIVGPFVKSHFLNSALKPGRRLSNSAQNSLWNDAADFDASLAALRAQVDRLACPDAAPNQKHPIFGRLTPAEWRLFHLRHCELHLSFLCLDSPAPSA